MIILLGEDRYTVRSQIKTKPIQIFYDFMLAWLYVRIDILLTCGKHLHNHITSLRVEVWAHKASLTLPLFIGVPVPSQESEWSCIWVLGVYIFPLSTIF